MYQNNTNILFPILVQKYSYKNHKDFKLFLTDFIKYKIKSFNGDWNDVTTLFQKQDDQKNISTFLSQPEKEIKDFKIFCEESGYHYTSEILQYEIEKIVITDSWINIYEKDSSVQNPHYHSNSFVCGNYFLNYIKQEHSPLCFLNPNSSFNQNLNSTFKVKRKINLNPLNSTESHVDCEEGDIVFWPSYLYHFVPKNKKIGRSTISMNLLPNKILNDLYGFEIIPLTL